LGAPLDSVPPGWVLSDSVVVMFVVLVSYAGSTRDPAARRGAW
jgi:hypothetical protein